MIYSDEALRNIIIENIWNKRIVYLASQLYYKDAIIWDTEYGKKSKIEEYEEELTKRLLNKDYERPRPEKPITRTVSLN